MKQALRLRPSIMHARRTHHGGNETSMLTHRRKSRVVGVFMRQKLMAVLLLWTSSASSGCGEAPPSSSPRVPSDASRFEIRSVNSAELRALVADADRPVLVEFSVLSGCYRCNDLRSPIRQRAADMQQHADVVRVDFNLNQGLAQQVGATVCPSYVVYSQGQVVSVRTWPTSADFVAGDVAAAATASATAEQADTDRVSNPAPQ
jgi:thioredoxin-like negative regulator of GroEL